MIGLSTLLNSLLLSALLILASHPAEAFAVPKIKQNCTPLANLNAMEEITKSYHQTGKAVDVFGYVDGKASWDTLHLTTIATCLLQASAQLGHELQWGGLWKGWQDLPHFQIKD